MPLSPESDNIVSLEQATLKNLLNRGDIYDRETMRSDFFTRSLMGFIENHPEIFDAMALFPKQRDLVTFVSFLSGRRLAYRMEPAVTVNQAYASPAIESIYKAGTIEKYVGLLRVIWNPARSVPVQRIALAGYIDGQEIPGVYFVASTTYVESPEDIESMFDWNEAIAGQIGRTIADNGTFSIIYPANEQRAEIETYTCLGEMVDPRLTSAFFLYGKVQEGQKDA